MIEPSVFFENIQSHYKQGLPFVAYAKPDANNVSAILQNDTALIEATDFSESGFVFAPFNSSEKTVLFPLNSSSKLETNRIEFKINTGFNQELSDSNNTAENFHIDLVKKAINTIKANPLKKVVISRAEVLEFEKLDVFSVFKKLLNTYKTAFVYCWYHPEIGLW